MLRRKFNQILIGIKNKIRKFAEFVPLETNILPSAIIDARNRRTLCNINVFEGNLKNANALLNEKIKSARKELR